MPRKVAVEPATPRTGPTVTGLAADPGHPRWFPVRSGTGLGRVGPLGAKPDTASCPVVPSTWPRAAHTGATPSTRATSPFSPCKAPEHFPIAGRPPAYSAGQGQQLLAALAFAQRWTAQVDWSTYENADRDLTRTHAYKESYVAEGEGVRLTLPSAVPE